MARIDLTKTETDNPSKAIERHYQELMAETDPRQLAADALDLALKAGNISEKNLRRFRLTLHQLGDDLAKLQYYITNFMLAGAGLSISRYN